MKETIQPASEIAVVGAPRPEQEAMDSAILKAVRSIHFGSVEVVVHNSKVVQIECRNRLRFHPASPKAAQE
jgi:hypothetical protein